ncbi:MAG: NUDIX domain-containing protein [Sedimentisphaerales bacterium]|nr:NUDIX domain-containing protein [Sedimentisphaerales bacterium]
MRAHFDAIFFSLAVVRENDRYVLVEEREPDGETAWYLPAGGVKPGEDFLGAAVRETREEAGIIIEPLGLLGADQILAEDGQTTKIRMVLLGKMVGGSLKTSPDRESVRAAWFHPDELRDLRLRDDEVIEWIEAAEKLRGSPLPLLTCYNRSRPLA